MTFHTITLKIFLCIILLSTTAFAQNRKDNLYATIRNGNIKKVKLLLDGTHNTQLLNDLLSPAIIAKHHDILQYLLDAGANPSYKISNTMPLLIQTIMLNRIKSAKILIENGADITMRGYRKKKRGLQVYWNWSVLMCASRIGNMPLIKTILKHKANIHDTGWSLSKNEMENSADIAAYSGHLDALKFFQKKGLKPSPKTIFKVTRSGYLDILKYLLQDIKNIDNPGPFRGRPLLIEAAWWGHTDIVTMLLKHGADINATDAYGYTAISESLDRLIESPKEQLEIITILVENNADLNLASKTNIRPYDRALKHAPEELQLYLKENGAEPTILEN